MSKNYYTHRPYLRQVLDSFDYNKEVLCLELGTGHGSALVFNEYLKKHKNLKVIAYEDNQEWLKMTKEKYQTKNYVFNYIDSWSTFDYSELKRQKFDLIFVDHMVYNNKWQERKNSVDELKQTTDIIIVHDYDYFNKKMAEQGYNLTNRMEQEPNIYSVSENTFWFDNYGSEFNLLGYKSELPPTLVMKKIK